MRVLILAGWVVTIAIVVFMIRDVSYDLRQTPWVIEANAGLGIPANMVLLVGIVGLISTVFYLVPQTSMLGAILLTAFLGGAVVIHLRVHGDIFDIGENVLIGVLTWAGLWMRDGRIRTLLPIMRANAPGTTAA